MICHERKVDLCYRIFETSVSSVAEMFDENSMLSSMG